MPFSVFAIADLAYTTSSAAAASLKKKDQSKRKQAAYQEFLQILSGLEQQDHLDSP